MAVPPSSPRSDTYRPPCTPRMSSELHWGTATDLQEFCGTGCSPSLEGTHSSSLPAHQTWHFCTSPSQPMCAALGALQPPLSFSPSASLTANQPQKASSSRKTKILFSIDVQTMIKARRDTWFQSRASRRGNGSTVSAGDGSDVCTTFLSKILLGWFFLPKNLQLWLS